MSPPRPVAFLHVGAMKTGTTYLQSKMIANRAELSEQGVHVLGRRWRDQVNAVQDLLSLAQHDPHVERRTDGAWGRLVEVVRTAPGRRSLLSMEFLSFADADQAARAVASLDGVEVHVVLTVRDTAGVVPALWQTTITSGGVMTWERFCLTMRASTRAGAGKVLASTGVASARRFREAVDIPRMVRAWTAVLPPSQVHVIVVPGPGAPRDRLWEHFASVVGFDPDACPEPPDQVNESLGYPSAELVRRVNAELRLGQPTEQRTVKVDLAREGLGRRREKERRVRLDDATYRACLRWNGRVRDVLESSGVAVVGDLADLPVEGERGSDADARSADSDQHEPTTDELLAAAHRGFRTLRREHRRRTERLGDDRRDREQAAVKEAVVGPKGWAAQPDPVAAAVTDLAVLVRAAVHAEQAGWKRRHRQRAKRRKRERRARLQARRSGTNDAREGADSDRRGTNDAREGTSDDRPGSSLS